MKICAVCNAENEDVTVFCTECGGKFPAAPEPQPAAPEPQPAAPEPQPAAPEPQPAAPEPQPAAPEPQPAASGSYQPSGFENPQHSGLDSGMAYLKFSANYQLSFRNIQQVIGRSELSAVAKTLGADPLEISRQHLTIYSESNKFYIVDGTTSVQEKPSSNHTKVNGKDITNQGAIELSEGDEVQFATTVKAVFYVVGGGKSSQQVSDNNSGGTDNPTNQMSDDEIKNKYDNMPDM
jgi:hypothetical protein